MSEEIETITLPPTALRRLARLHARFEGAQAVYVAAMQAAQAAQNTLQTALNEECSELGMQIPTDRQAPVDVDWRTGHVRLRQESPNGHAAIV